MYAYRKLDIACGIVMGKKDKKENQKCKGTKKVVTE